MTRFPSISWLSPVIDGKPRFKRESKSVAPVARVICKAAPLFACTRLSVSFYCLNLDLLNSQLPWNVFFSNCVYCKGNCGQLRGATQRAALYCRASAVSAWYNGALPSMKDLNIAKPCLGLY